MSKNFVETLVGAIVILIAIGFLYSAYKTTDMNISTNQGYVLNAKFDRADGINLGSEVRVGGIKIGKVIALELDEKTYQAIIKMVIKNEVTIPSDSSAEIIGNGLLGEKYVSIVPGIEEEKFANDDTITFTQSSVSLESLIGKFIFSSAEKAGQQ